MNFQPLNLLLFFCLLATAASSTKPEVEIYNAESQPVMAIEHKDLGTGLGAGLGAASAFLKSLGSVSSSNGVVGVGDAIVGDQDASASQKRSAGYGSGGYGGGGGGSLIGSGIGGTVGGLLGGILRSLTGIGLRLGINLNNEFYNVPEYSYGGYGGGGGAYSNNYETVYQAPAVSNDNNNGYGSNQQSENGYNSENVIGKY